MWCDTIREKGGEFMEIKKMSSNKTVVKGLRASQEFFDRCDLVAKAEGIGRNKLIVRVVSEYCDGEIKYCQDSMAYYINKAKGSNNDGN